MIPITAPAAATTQPVEAAVGFGANLGDKLANLAAALAAIRAIPGVALLAKSGVYETEPVDVPPEFADKPFANAVAVFAVASMTSDEWSRRLHAIEDALLRTRGRVPHLPRTIDLDLLTFGDEIRNDPHLRLPHPQIASRRFVCQPLAEIRPNLILPTRTEPITRLLKKLPEKPAVRLTEHEFGGN